MTATWEEAAEAAMDLVPRNLMLGQSESAVDEVDHYIDVLRKQPHVEYRSDKYGFLADTAIQAYCENGGGPTISREYAEDLVVRTICQKQHDYGHDNILWAGEDGLLVRMHDKTARIRNLMSRGDVAANESLEDSWLDVVGYALIGIMLCEGTFERQLAADLEDDPFWTHLMELAGTDPDVEDITGSSVDDDEYDELDDPDVMSFVTENEAMLHIAVYPTWDSKGPKCWIASQTKYERDRALNGDGEGYSTGPYLDTDAVETIHSYLGLVLARMRAQQSVDAVEAAGLIVKNDLEAA